MLLELKALSSLIKLSCKNYEKQKIAITFKLSFFKAIKPFFIRFTP